MGTVDNAKEIVTIGGRATSGNAAISGAKAAPSQYYHFVNWTAETDDANWTPEASYEALPKTLTGVTGGKTYTFTANFAVDTYTVIFDGNGGEWTMAPNPYSFAEGSKSRIQRTGVPATELLYVATMDRPINSGSAFKDWMLQCANGEEKQIAAGTAGNIWGWTGLTEGSTITIKATWDVVPLTYSYVQHFLNAEGKEEGALDIREGNQANPNTKVADLLVLWKLFPKLPG